MLKKIFLACFLFLFNFCVFADIVGSNTGYKIPRFLSLKSDEVNLRIGPSTKYPIIIKYTQQNLPIKIIDENKSWREIIDYEGNRGWIHKTLIKGERFAIIKEGKLFKVKVFNKPKGKNIGEIGKFNIVKIKKCLTNWCLINFNSNKGWVNKNNLWGVFESEEINIPFYQNIIIFFWKLNF